MTDSPLLLAAALMPATPTPQDLSLLAWLAQQSVPFALAIVGVLLILGLILKASGFSGIGKTSKLVDDDKIAAIAENLGAIEKRLGTVEHDVSQRATRDEMHRLELSFTRMEGRFESLSATTQATANAVSRIEEYMYSAALRIKEQPR